MRHFSRLLVIAFFLLSQYGYAQTCDMYVGGYVPSYRNASGLDYSKVSHVFYAFAGSNPSGTLILDSSIAGNFTAFKAETVGKKRYLSIEGGDTVNTIRHMAGNPTARASFVTNCVNFCTNNSFDGIDMDWENIDNATDSANFHSLVSALSTALHANGYKLIITLSYNYNARYYGTASLNTADWIQLMVYDETGWGPGSPYGNHSSFASIENAIAYWTNKGYTDRSKIVIGLPFYGYQFASHAGGTGVATTYSQLVAANPNLQTDVDSVALTPFNSAALLKRKVDHVKFSGLKGVFVWEMGQDIAASSTKSLLRAISDAACDQNPLWADYSVSYTTSLAQGRPVESSSGPSNVSKIVDNSPGTFWTSSSANADTAWIHVDLGNTYEISKVEILWEQSGIGRDFEVKIASSSTGDWTTIQQRFYNSSLTNTLQGLRGAGRYIAIQGLSRGCNARYKIAEFRVYGSLVTGSRSPQQQAPAVITAVAPPVKNVIIEKSEGIKVYPNPANQSITIDLSAAPANVQRLELIDNTGKPVHIIQGGLQRTVQTINVAGWSTGMYLLRTILKNQESVTQKVLIRH